MKKALISILSLLVISVAVFAGGDSEATATEEEKIVLNVMGYGDNSNAEGISWMRIVESFEEEYPGIDIQYEMLYDEAYHQKVVARLASGNIPDVAYMGADARWGAPWKEADQQYDHSSIIDGNYYDLNLIPDMDPEKPGKQIYEIPLGTSNITTVLYMNKALVEEMGFSQPETYEDLVAMVPAARAAGIDVVSIDGADGWAWGSCLMSAIIARVSGDPQWVSKAVAGENKFTDKEFIDSLALIEKMVADGVISERAVLVDYGTNISNYTNRKALFMVQGQWAAGGIEDPEVAASTIMMAWPKLPGEKEAMAGSVAAAIQVGYGLTKKGASDEKIAEASMTFLQYYFSEAETTQRLIDGAIVAPILKGYQVPEDLPYIMKQKVSLAQNAMNTEVIDAFLSGAPNDALNAGMQKIASGTATPEEVAAEVESLLRK